MADKKPEDPPLKEFRIQCPVEKARGHQTYTVQAKDEADALARHNAGQSEFDSEDIEVTQLGTPTVEEV